MSVAAAIEVPSTCTIAPIRGSPWASVTVPFSEASSALAAIEIRVAEATVIIVLCKFIGDEMIGEIRRGMTVVGRSPPPR